MDRTTLRPASQPLVADAPPAALKARSAHASSSAAPASGAGGVPAAVLFDLYETLITESPAALPSGALVEAPLAPALGLDPDRRMAVAAETRRTANVVSAIETPRDEAAAVLRSTRLTVIPSRRRTGAGGLPGGPRRGRPGRLQAQTPGSGRERRPAHPTPDRAAVR